MDKRKAVKHMLSTLTKVDFDNFCNELMHRKGEPQVVRIRVEGKNYFEITEVLLSTFNDTGAVEVAAELLNEINCKKEADELLAATGVKYSEPGSSNNPRKELSQRNVSAESRVPADQMLRSVRTEFINRVSQAVLEQLLDKLLEREVITYSEMTSARGKPQFDKAREVVDTVHQKGAAACRVLINALREIDPYIYKELNLS
ncbi:baculoviral IAP repeat-containing protein 2-like [Trematomus bernacchii]|uniref:baculoviral IAP repeat-containing protein 2-like n=1 Tax=Trematomus bernacchii TaxID=40690 RepID=UPI00146E5E27|nr:baculoviral IAP repeat-containing protein 2-like [Trematomus bernacchii]